MFSLLCSSSNAHSKNGAYRAKECGAEERPNNWNSIPLILSAILSVFHTRPDQTTPHHQQVVVCGTFNRVSKQANREARPYDIACRLHTILVVRRNSQTAERKLFEFAGCFWEEIRFEDTQFQNSQILFLILLRGPWIFDISWKS